jgi:hypothetical protein
VQLRELLVRPGIAGTLGFLVGVGLITVIAWSKNLASSSDPQDGIVVTMMAMMGAMLVASGVLIAYVLLARSGFIYFGLALSAGFVIGFGVIAFGMIRESYRD